MGTRAPRTLLVLAAAVSVGAAGVLTASPGFAAPSRVTIRTVVTGLNAPRGIAFDARGNLYVAESGQAGSGPQGLTHTGQVSKFVRGKSAPAWTTSFESVYASEDPTQPPDVLGPEGLGALAASCHRNGRKKLRRSYSPCEVRMIMSESHDGVAALSGGVVSTTQIGHLYRFNARNGHPTELSDVGDQMYAWTGARKRLFPDDFPDSNPYAVLLTKDGRRVRTFVADAGANTISEVRPSGKLRVIAYIPNETKPPKRDATPTCIAQGPDGNLYVATLDLVANIVGPNAKGGRSNVWKVDPNADYPKKPKLWATGLTTATACTFDRAGNFWATEMFKDNGSSAPPGDVVRIRFSNPKKVRHFGGGRLPLPGGIAQAPNGALYVTTHSADPTPNSGQVVKLRVR